MSKNGDKSLGLQVLILIGVAIGAAVLINLVHPKRIPWVQDWGSRVEAQAVSEEIPLVQLADMLKFLRDGSRLFVDARSAEKYARGHLPAALSLPFETLDDQTEAVAAVLASERPPVFYCSGPECDDSLLLALHLRELGCEDGAVFIGGMELWQSELLITEGEASP